MEINKELKHIAEYQNSILPRHQKRTEEAIEIIANDAIESLKNGTFDFKSFLHLDLNQNGKHRQVIMYKPFSPEELLCIFLKRVLDRKFHISYPNRNEYIRTLFDTAAAIKDMSDYTIFKFDFSDFFNTVSSEYVYHKYIQSASLERYQDKLMANFVNATKYTFAGLNTSNILCEIIARDFDQRLVQRFSKQGIILYKRYLIYSRYHSDYHKEILIWVEELLQYKVNQIGSKDPLLQKEFWYVITFINCPYISGSVKTALEGIVRPMATAAETNLANKIKKIIAEFLLQNKSNLFFCWGYYHFNTSKQLTFRTYQRTLFKQYKNKRSIELYGSLDT